MKKTYEQLASKVKKWNKENSIKLELYRTYKDSFKGWGKSQGYKYSLYTENGDLVAQGTLQAILEDLLFNKSYSKLLYL